MDTSGQAALEQALRERLEAGDEPEALRLLIESYGPEILGYLTRTMRDETDAAEVFSAFCEDLCRGIGTFQGRSSARTWAYRLASNARARFWADPYRRRAEGMLSEEISRLEQHVRTRTLAYLRTEVKDRFARLREQLDAEEQSLLTLRVNREMGWSEIAEVLAGEGEALSEKELQARAALWRQRFKRLKDKIRKIADEQGLLEGD